MLPMRTHLLTLFLCALPMGCAALAEQWRQEHCHFDGAYQDGVNDARLGRVMDADYYVDQCTADAAQAVRDGYRRGYETGLNAGGPARAAAPDLGQPTCRSTLDCKGSGFCKDRGDGLMLCMNKGGRGDYCTSGIDCAGGAFCKPSPDGLKTCQ
ncbi:MAG: hypothetical protein JNJ59_08890 [Deltaproteobacteria bacterium]|jgi:hypothetical protein|nr:hypothetical protein [Deltaproteobacteria bacterium]